jgi:acetyltransferase-like isoleucine patch superfamily enzyme
MTKFGTLVFLKLGKAIRSPSELLRVVNAQLRLRHRATTPFTVRLQGTSKIFGTGSVVFGEGVSLNGTVVPIEFNTYSAGSIEVGAHTFINYGSSLAAHSQIKIGAFCLLGHYALIMDNNQYDLLKHNELPPSKPIIIEDHVWIGSHVVILQGVRIGSHAAVGAGSIVTRNIPPRCLAAGNPARVIRYFKDDR